MSPRSRELIDKARGRLAAAGRAMQAGDAELAVSAAYYSMLYAARAALSERDLYAKTHRGVWSEFSRVFVATGEVDMSVGRLGAGTQRLRELADYEAEDVTAARARATLGDAGRFIAAVETMLGEG